MRYDAAAAAGPCSESCDDVAATRDGIRSAGRNFGLYSFISQARSSPKREI